jgi:hypothetical protein
MNELDCNVFWQNKLKENILKGFSDEKSKQDTLEYKEKCEVYDKKSLDCISLNTQIGIMQSELGNQALMYFENNKVNKKEDLDKLKKSFSEQGCTKVIEQYRQKEVGKVVDKFSSLDKARIEQESKYVRNQRVFFGGLVLLGGLVIITMFSKNK